MSARLDGMLFGQEELSLPRRLALALVRPGRSFAAVAGRESAADWLAPALLACAVGLVAHFATVHLVTDPNSPYVQRAMQAMDEAAREKYLQGAQVLRAHGWLMVPVGVFSSLVVVGALVMVVARALFGAELSFRQALVLKGYGTMALIPEWLVRTPLLLWTGNPDVRTGPLPLVAPGQARDLLTRVLAGINFFDLWQVWIVASGVAVLGGTSARRSAVALAALYLAWVVAGAWLEGVRAPAPGPVGPG